MNWWSSDFKELVTNESLEPNSSKFLEIKGSSKESQQNCNQIAFLSDSASSRIIRAVTSTIAVRTERQRLRSVATV